MSERDLRSRSLIQPWSSPGGMRLPTPPGSLRELLKQGARISLPASGRIGNKTAVLPRSVLHFRPMIRPALLLFAALATGCGKTVTDDDCRKIGENMFAVWQSEAAKAASSDGADSDK